MCHTVVKVVGHLTDSLPVCWIELGFADQFHLGGRYFCLWCKILLRLLSSYTESSSLELRCPIFQLPPLPQAAVVTRDTRGEH